MRLTVIIPTFNGRHLLEGTLAGNIAVLGSNATQWIVADDGSSDDTVAWVTATFPQVQVVVSPHNQGFAGTVSMGAEAATGSHLLFLNNDMAIRQWDWDLLSTAFHAPDCFAVTPTIIRPTKDNAFESFTWGQVKGGWFSAECYVPPHLKTLRLSGRPILWACGGAMVVPRDKYNALGGFDTLFSPFYFEDLDLSYRAWKRGWQCKYLAFGLVHHQHQATIGRLFQKRQVEHIHRTHHYLFMWKNLDDFSYKLGHFLTVVVKIITLQFKDIRAIAYALRRLPVVISYRRRRPVPTVSDHRILAPITASGVRPVPLFEGESPE